MEPIVAFITDIMAHVASHLQPHEVKHFTECIFQKNESFQAVIKQLKVDEYHYLMDQYTNIIQTKTHVSFPETLEQRVRALEREQEKSRIIENSFVELLQEQRVYFENKLAKTGHS
jgi:hypothetical protein